MKSLYALLGTFAVAVGVGYFILAPEEDLPILEPRDINPALIDADVRMKSRHSILPFELVNQRGDTVTKDDVTGQILIVDFFFTRCPTICPIMTENLKKAQDALIDESGVMILSHSVTPQADSVPVLHSYAERYNADANRWWFLTGEKKAIYKLARKSYFTCLEEGDGGMQDFIHTENVALVDGMGRLRGFYDGTDETAVNQLVEDVRLLNQKKNEKK
ncbi:MAG: SCO family protein [Flavobacteriales bacterium]